MRRRLLALLALFTLAIAPAQKARADPAVHAAQQPDSGDTLIREAVAAYARGELARARVLFEEAHFSAPNARTLRGLGVVALREQRYVDALRFLEASLASPDKPLTNTLREGVVALLTEARAALATLRLSLSPVDAVASEDGAPVPRDAAGALLLVPGNHTLSCSAPGHAGKLLSVTLSAGAEERLEVALPELSAAPDTMLAVAPDAHPPTEAAEAPRASSAPLDIEPVHHGDHGDARRRRLRRAFYGLLGATGLALVMGAVASGVGIARVHAIERTCRRNPDGLCDRAEVDGLVAARHLPRLGALATTGFVGAGVAAAGAIAVTPFVYGHAAGGGRDHALGLLLSARY